MHRILVIATLTASLFGCAPVGYGGSLSQPDDARVAISDDILIFNTFDSELRKTLFRYLAGNSRWEIRRENGHKYAVRREKVDGEYQTTLNGFYSHYDGDSVRQTRVIISFDKPFGFGHDRGNITRVKASSGEAGVIVEDSHQGTPGNSSYLIIQGEGVYLEIFDQAPEVERKFTKATISDVCGELAEVKEHQEELRSSGEIAASSRYAGEHPQAAHFKISDGMQPGIYLLDAAVNTTSSGSVYAKVFDTQSGKRLSAQRISPRSTRYVGWSENGKSFFPYHAEVTVYEGDWSTKYEARFELWHHPEQGPETKIAETTRLINGWQR